MPKYTGRASYKMGLFATMGAVKSMRNAAAKISVIGNAILKQGNGRIIFIRTARAPKYAKIKVCQKLKKISVLKDGSAMITIIEAFS